MSSDRSADVRLGWPILLAMDMHLQSPTTLAPPPDPRLATSGWLLHGYLTGVDAIFRRYAALELGGARVCYGLVLEDTTHPGHFLVAIRGTAELIEWLEDAEFNATPYPGGGEVETGFWELYSTLAYLPAALGAQEVPLIPALTALTQGAAVTVAGHSLGAALAPYLTLDLAETPGLKVSGRYFAPPRPGNGAFADLFDRTVADYVAYTDYLDVVPHVPVGLGYCPLKKLIAITPAISQARIAFGIGARHHLVCYLAQLDYAFQDWRSLPPIDQGNAVCIKGPIPRGA